jgi:hypothetical protein
MNARRVDSEQQLYRGLRERYEVGVEMPLAERKARAEFAGAAR